jgi:hypothetical protein
MRGLLPGSYNTTILIKPAYCVVMPDSQILKNTIPKLFYQNRVPSGHHPEI